MFVMMFHDSDDYNNHRNLILQHTTYKFNDQVIQYWSDYSIILGMFSCSRRKQKCY